MKYEAIFFDFANTLYNTKTKSIPRQLTIIIKTVYKRGYRLALISNSLRYTDGISIRKKLDAAGILSYFELTLFSATIGISKPNHGIFRRAIDFMGVNPKRTLFVGDLPRSDGGCKKIGIDFLHVDVSSKLWAKGLMVKLNDQTHEKRKLSHIKEFIWQDGFLCPKITHLCEPISKGDHVLVNGVEYKILEEIPKKITKEMILDKNNDFRIPLKLRQVD